MELHSFAWYPAPRKQSALVINIKVKIKINKEISFDLYKKLEIVDNFSNFLNGQINDISFGKGVNSMSIVLNCVDPEMGIAQDFETGILIYVKYTKSKKNLEFDFKLNHTEVKNTNTEEELLNVVSTGLQKSLVKLKELGIQYFDITKFETEFKLSIDRFNKTDYTHQNDPFNYELSKDISTTNYKMKEVVFWEIIEQSREESNDYNNQLKIIIEKLGKLDENEIIGFEFTFRKVLAKSAHYNIMAAVKIINDFGSDDNSLYFRCRLIAEGKDMYNSAIKNPETLISLRLQEIEFGGEEMLYLADAAFIEKFGENTDKELPRNRALNYLNYDEGEELKGVDWKEEELPFKYPKLWKKFKR